MAVGIVARVVVLEWDANDITVMKKCQVCYRGGCRWQWL